MTYSWFSFVILKGTRKRWDCHKQWSLSTHIHFLQGTDVGGNIIDKSVLMQSEMFREHQTLYSFFILYALTPTHIHTHTRLNSYNPRLISGFVGQTERFCPEKSVVFCENSQFKIPVLSV